MQGSFKGIRVTKRGVSPRIVSAEVVGSRGRTPVDGATLRARLGLFDTWAYFTAIKGEADPRRPTARAARPRPRPFAFACATSAGVLRGTVIGPRAGARLTVQERRGDRWVNVGTVRTDRARRATAGAAHARGTYRVVVGGAGRRPPVSALAAVVDAHDASRRRRPASRSPRARS